MHLYKTKHGIYAHHDGNAYALAQDWDALVNQPNLHQHLQGLLKNLKPVAHAGDVLKPANLLAPIASQEVWAAGVTYLRSRDARMEESEESGGADFYSKVYGAERPELFFKSSAHRVSGPGEPVNIRKDSDWNVPEPELTLFINAQGSIQGYTIGNDMSSRSIEGENPLYLPQAKVYERSAALGPCLYVPAQPIPASTTISIAIARAGKEMFSGSIKIDRIKRTLTELASYLYRGLAFPHGCYLMTGTGIVPGSDFTLQKGDEVKINIEGIGTLVNVVDVL